MATPPEQDEYAPILPGAGGSDYERYLRTDELLALQKGPDEWVHLVLFLVVAYSAPRLRFKERPVLDSFTSAMHFATSAHVNAAPPAVAARSE